MCYMILNEHKKVYSIPKIKAFIYQARQFISDYHFTITSAMISNMIMNIIVISVLIIIHQSIDMGMYKYYGFQQFN